MKEGSLLTVNKHKSAGQINLAVRGMASNFVIACSTKAKFCKTAWTKPRMGYMKLNVDAGFDQDQLEGTVGAIIRDHDGKSIAAANEKMSFCFYAFTAEATAVRFGLNLARTLGCSKLELVSDNADVVLALQEGRSSSVAGATFDDCFYMTRILIMLVLHIIIGIAIRWLMN